jgi:hypothetical protein
MPDLRLMPLLVLSGTLVIAGASLIAVANRVDRPGAEAAPWWQRVAPLWGVVLMAEGVGQLMFWLWSADTGYGQPASDAFLLALLAALVLPPLAYGVWRSRSFRSSSDDGTRVAGPGSLDLAYALAGGAIALALATIVVQWELERLSGAWVQVAHYSPGYRVPDDDFDAQILAHSLLRLVTIIRFAGGLAFSMGVLALALSNRRPAGARWLAGAGVLLSVGAVWTHWLWLERLRWS